MSEVREFFVGPLIVAGGLTRGRHLRAIEQIGADFGLLGTSFIAATCNFASDAYLGDMLIESGADDIAIILPRSPAFPPTCCAQVSSEPASSHRRR